MPISLRRGGIPAEAAPNGTRPFAGSAAPFSHDRWSTEVANHAMPCEGLGQGKTSQVYHAAGMEQHLAQINVARLRAPMDSPVMAEFVGLLDPVNKIADESPGFVWRLQTDDGNATSIRAFDDDMIAVNMSVW